MRFSGISTNGLKRIASKLAQSSSGEDFDFLQYLDNADFSSQQEGQEADSRYSNSDLTDDASAWDYYFSDLHHSDPDTLFWDKEEFIDKLSKQPVVTKDVLNRLRGFEQDEADKYRKWFLKEW